jgi:error-prone DNA polymerase
MFIHLHVHSNFSFYDGAAPLTDLVEEATRLEMPALAVTDHNSLAGAVRFYQAARKAGIKPIIGVEFDIEPVARAEGQGTRLLLLALDNDGYSHLCRLVTCAQLGEARSAGPFAPQYQEVDRKHPLLTQEHLRQYASHVLGISPGVAGEVARHLQAGDHARAAAVARYYAELFGPGDFYLELQHHGEPPRADALHYRLRRLAEEVGLPVVAGNDVHYVTRDYAALQEALFCLGQGISVHDRHPGRKPNAEYYLKSSAQMAALFADYPEALAATEEIADRCSWELDLETIHLPRFDAASAPDFLGDSESPGDPNSSADHAAFLECLCRQALPCTYTANLRAAAERQLDHELGVINQRGLADYFLIVWDLVRFAESRGIRHSGRGSAADSIVCYLLDLTQPEPLSNDLLFERFLNPERRDLPDIDLDFDSDRRDEIVAYVYRKYGPEHVAAVATVNTFRARAAVRELGKVLGLSEGQISRVARNFAYVDLHRLPEMLEALPEARGVAGELAYEQTLLRLCEQVAGFPRHLAVHVGGLVISTQPLTDLVPLQLANKGIAVAQYDKDDIEALGLLKMDLLGLRIHTAIEHGLHLIRQRDPDFDLGAVPLDDPAAYELIRSTNTLGLFQLESPGQRNLQGRLLADDFEDIIAGISLFRPGPVQADMISPFIARRLGQEPVVYLHPALEPILARTYGVMIYQEQVMRVAAAIGGFTLGEADRLRKAMNWDSATDAMQRLHDTFMEGARRQEIGEAVAEQIFSQVAAFAAFGFNKAHAASFARISYETAYLKAHYPAEYIAGLLTAQPMGFYPARTLAEEAKRLGIAILPPCVNRSEADYTVERALPGTAGIRTGLRFLRDMSGSALKQILAARAAGGPFLSLRDFLTRANPPYPVMENLILARAFDWTGQTIPQLLGLLAALHQRTGKTYPPSPASPRPVGRRGGQGGEAALTLDLEEPQLEMSARIFGEEITPYQRLQLDLHLLGLSTELNPFAPWVEMTARQGVIPTARLLEYPHRARVKVAGIVVARARPPVRSGRTTLFLCLEDHTGLVDITIFQEAYQKYGDFLYTSPVLLAEGELTRRGARDVAVTVKRVQPLPLSQARGEAPVPAEELAEVYRQTGPGSYGS